MTSIPDSGICFYLLSKLTVITLDHTDELKFYRCKISVHVKKTSSYEVTYSHKEQVN
jgi:hypothetical protein